MPSFARDEARDNAAKQIEARLGLPRLPRLIDSAHWYEEKFGTAGNWDSWVWETVTGRDYETRKPHFDGYVVIGDRLGKAGAAIVDLALRNNRAVLGWSDDVLRQVTALRVIDPEDMSTGWGLQQKDLR